MQNVYISTLFRYLLNKLETEITDKYDSSNSICLTLLIIFLVLLAFVYVLFWIPIFHKISVEVNFYHKINYI